jgi:hypothetical protein
VNDYFTYEQKCHEARSRMDQRMRDAENERAARDHARARRQRRRRRARMAAAFEFFFAARRRTA